MTSKTRILWTEQSWNPVTGCTKLSAGCKHCYAEAMALRLHAMGVPAYTQGFALTLHEARLQEPLRKKTPTVFFVCSMGDLFHENVPDAFIENVLAIATKTPRHTYQLLTKRAGRMAQFFQSRPVPANVWLGVTVEDRRDGLPRMDRLRQIPTRIRFLSIEPLLEDLGRVDLSGIHWVLVGGESGSAARPMQAHWARSVRDHCQAAGVAFLFKQWGAWGPDGVRRSKHANGRHLDGRVWDERPEIQGALL